MSQDNSNQDKRGVALHSKAETEGFIAGIRSTVPELARHAALYQCAFHAPITPEKLDGLSEAARAWVENILFRVASEMGIVLIQSPQDAQDWQAAMFDAGAAWAGTMAQVMEAHRAYAQR